MKKLLMALCLFSMVDPIYSLTPEETSQLNSMELLVGKDYRFIENSKSPTNMLSMQQKKLTYPFLPTQILENTKINQQEIIKLWRTSILSLPLKRNSNWDSNDLLNSVENQFAAIRDLNILFGLKTFQSIDKEAVQFAQILGQNKSFLMHLGGYVFIHSNQFTASRPNLDLKTFVNERNSSKKTAFGESLINQYKIHLMPQSFDQMITIIETILTNKDMKKYIDTMKFRARASKNNYPILLTDLRDEPNEFKRYPILVIYPGGTKKEAQELLNLLYNKFGYLEGADITPRFNKKINSLIYYSQGDSDHKIGNFTKYFDAGTDLVFYDPEKFGLSYNSDDSNPFELCNPAEGKPCGVT